MSALAALGHALSRSVCSPTYRFSSSKSSLALPDQDFRPGDHGACPAVATAPVFVLLVDGGRHAVRPVLPEGPCGEPRAEVRDALDSLDFSVVKEFSYRQPAS